MRLNIRYPPEAVPGLNFGYDLSLWHPVQTGGFPNDLPGWQSAQSTAECVPSSFSPVTEWLNDSAFQSAWQREQSLASPVNFRVVPWHCAHSSRAWYAFSVHPVARPCSKGRASFSAWHFV